MQGLDGLIVFLKYDCPTCLLITSVLETLQKNNKKMLIYVQDRPDKFDSLDTEDDRALRESFKFNIETVPTLLRLDKGVETSRTVGWEVASWEEITGVSPLGSGLPAMRPGCGSMSVEPGTAEKLAIRFGDVSFHSRAVESGSLEDDIEFCFDKGWSDGLPVVPPTQERVYRMLQGTDRSANDVLGLVPPNHMECTVEKVAANAVMAGCKPEFLPVVLAAVEAALEPAFCLHGLIATTWLSGPMVIVNGEVRRQIGMNWKGNVLGQGNRANATIGRALQLTVRNVGGGRPQEVDQATFGTPLKLGFCFAEDESTPWKTLAEDAGFVKGQSTVTVFSADGPVGCIDQRSREPNGLVDSIAGSLKIVNHITMANASDAVIIIGPEHGRIFDAAGWSKEQAVDALQAATKVSNASDLRMGTHAETVFTSSQTENEKSIPKFRKGGLTLIRAGGDAGLFSAIIPGWLMKGATGTEPITKEVI